MNWIEKMVDTFYDGHDELYHHAKFGEDRTTHAGYRCENQNVVFVCVFFCFLLLPAGFGPKNIKNFHVLVKSRLEARGEPLGRFLKF